MLCRHAAVLLCQPDPLPSLVSYQAYRLHRQAVEDLVSANEENTPQYSEEELDQYRSHRKGRTLPAGIKIALIKAWFYGAVCYFVFWGLGLYVRAQLDLMVAAGAVMGMVTDLLINSLLRFMERRKGESRAYMMVTLRGTGGLLLNLLYGEGLMFLVVTMYAAVNLCLSMLGAGMLGVGPLMFGVFATLADSALIRGKRMLGEMIRDARRK